VETGEGREDQCQKKPREHFISPRSWVSNGSALGRKPPGCDLYRLGGVTTMLPHSLLVLGTFLLLFASATTAGAQELEPRRWSHLPINTNFHAIGYAYAEGDLSFDPVLQINDATVEIHTLALRYIRTFDLFGLSGRVDLVGAYQDGTWEGKLGGTPAQVSREGWADPSVRLVVNLYGAPPLEPKEYVEYRAKQESETIVGVGLAVQFPLGEYFDEKLINLGNNRFAFRPQLGVVHNQGKWGFELTASTWIFTDNDDFFGGLKREQKPFYTIQGHAQYHIDPKLWISSGVAFGIGQESTINGDHKDDRRENIVFATSVGYAITRNIGLTVGYLGTRALADTGLDFDSVIVGVSLFWPDSLVRKALGLGGG
jgi:hypothetical protein